MEFDTFYDYVSGLPYVEVCTPFGPDTLVFKIGGKVFLLAGLEPFSSFNAKCDPEYALKLREFYMGIVPGYHMNKKHWNTIQVREDVPIMLMKELIQHSYDLVYGKLPKQLKSTLPL